MKILFVLLALAIIGPAVFIAFEIPGTNENYQMWGILGCFLLAVAGIAIGSADADNIGAEGFGAGVIFVLSILSAGIASLIYWYKKK